MFGLRYQKRWLVGAVLLTVLLSGGCFESFEPYWSVDKYRILAIKSDPVMLEPGESARLSVLDAIPPDTSVDYSWTWCPVTTSAQDEYECPVEELAGRLAESGSGVGDGTMAAPGPELDPSLLDLGGGKTAEMLYPGNKEQILGFCERIQEAVAEAGQQSNLGNFLPTTDCRTGYNISVRLEATTDGGETHVAKKEFKLWTGSEQVNANPAIDGLQIRVSKTADIEKARSELAWVPSGDKERSEQWHTLPSKGVTPVLAGMTFDLRAKIDEASAQEYRPPPPKGADVEKVPEETEALGFRWFASQGDLEDAKRIYVPDTNKLSNARKSGLTLEPLGNVGCGPDNEKRSCLVEVWSVVRDGRLGLDYEGAKLQIVGEVPEGAGE